MESKVQETHAGVVDVDPDLLHRSARAIAHAAKGGIDHVLAEQTGDVDLIVETLAPEGPFGYTIRQQLSDDGLLRVPILTTRDEIYEEYKAVRGLSDILAHQAIVDIRGHWYLFHDVLNISRRKSDGRVAESNSLVLCPVKGSSGGITGEIFWYRSPRENLGRGDTYVMGDADRNTLLLRHWEMHETYLDAMRRGDVEAMVALTNASVQMAIRDYVNDTGTLTQPETEEGKERATYRNYWLAFFERFEVIAIDQLERVIEEWYVFAELRLTLRIKETGEMVAFNTAEFQVPAKDGLLIAHIGHGTDIVAVN
jgi:hypothetical protein